MIFEPLIPGGKLSAANENAKADALENLVSGIGARPGFYAPNGERAEMPMLSGDGTVGFACKVTAVHDDTLTCVLWDGSATSGPVFSVAKPIELRRSTWDGVTEIGVTFAMISGNPQERTASAVAGTEVHQIFPLYAIHSIIRVIYLANGAGLNDENGSPIFFEDLNTAPRAWLCRSSA